MEFQVTVRYGVKRQAYHTFELDAENIREALSDAAGALPDEVAETGTLVEIRPAVDPEARVWVGAAPE